MDQSLSVAPLELLRGSPDPRQHHVMPAGVRVTTTELQRGQDRFQFSPVHAVDLLSNSLFCGLIDSFEDSPLCRLLPHPRQTHKTCSTPTAMQALPKRENATRRRLATFCIERGKNAIVPEQWRSPLHYCRIPRSMLGAVPTATHERNRHECLCEELATHTRKTQALRVGNDSRPSRSTVSKRAGQVIV